MTTSRRKWPSVAGALLAVGTLLSTLFILFTLPPSPSFVRHRPLLYSGLGNHVTDKPQLGRYGELMLSFLRPDLPFTLFIPRPSLFESMLLSMNHKSNTSGTLFVNSSVVDEENSYAVVSRIFGFSAIPRYILSSMMALNCEREFDSVAGFRLNLVRVPPRGTFMVNNLACSAVDIIKGHVVVHLVDGILMDADFEQSFMPFQEDMAEEP
ncbi:hypothetical protein L7F22_026708 [Adiantum nelumboides]|nr:hypothetical protein [Adiantum nelumboides]